MAARPSRYAEGTTVEVARTRGEIEALLAKHGATGFLSAWAQQGEHMGAFIQFRLGERMIKYPVRYPEPEEVGGQRGKTNLRNGRPVKIAQEQEWRRRWRALFLIIKAKIELVAGGDSTVEREFLADILLPDGRTAGDVVSPELAAAYEQGAAYQFPGLLLGPGGKGSK